MNSDSAELAKVPIVGIGSSAGGIDALRLLFSEMPKETGLAFVVVAHLEAERTSLLGQVIGGFTSIPVVEVVQGMHAEPNRIHVIPSGFDLRVSGSIFTLEQRQANKLHLPINTFFSDLAETRGSRAIGIVLSGTASDGTDGLRAIQEAGGITFAQTSDSAQFAAMPDNAVAAGVVDLRLSPEAIANELVQLSHHTYLTGHTSLAPTPMATDSEPAAIDEKSLSLVLASIREHTHLDFHGYKRPTLLRRIARRMALQQIHSLSDYATSLKTDPSQAKILGEDLLIHVTSFFRDPTVFEALKRDVLPEVLKNKQNSPSLRIWVAGCSTGQEPYSLGICVLEFLAEHNLKVDVKIFASDLSEAAIETARAGIYCDSDLINVSSERLANFFDKVEEKYRINRRVRELCVFVRQDLGRDPPFARMDLISCRNVLIYFDPELQRRVLAMLHQCLNRPGYLLMGSSEAINGFSHLFSVVDKESRIFVGSGESQKVESLLPSGPSTESRPSVVRPFAKEQPTRDAQRQADHILLSRYAPPAVVIDAHFDVVQFRGRTGDFLESPPGQPQTNVLKMAREGLATPLREALERARQSSSAATAQGLVNLPNELSRKVGIEVVPLGGLPGNLDRFYLIAFSETNESPPDNHQPQSRRAFSQDGDEVAHLRAELAAMKDYLQAMAGENQDTTDELAAANEEFVAANEELQSTNEELQSAKEEVQSTNEELTTVNEELQNRNNQLDVVVNDLINVFDSVQIPIIMVDDAMRVRRFTPTARQVSKLVPADIGRNIDDIKLTIKLEALVPKIQESIAAVAPKEWQVQGWDGCWYNMTIRPYRRADNRLEGAVISFLDVNTLKRAVNAAESARDYALGIVKTVPVSLLVLDQQLRVMTVNPRFEETFRGNWTQAPHACLFQFAQGAFDQSALREAVAKCMAMGSSFTDLEIRCSFPAGDHRDLFVSGCRLPSAEGEVTLLLALEDVTMRRTLEASEKLARVDAEQANRAKDLFLATLSHELRTPLTAILLSAQILQSLEKDNLKVQRATASITRAVGNQAKLIDDLLDISRIVSGKLSIEMQAISLSTVVEGAVEVARESLAAKAITLETSIETSTDAVLGDPTRLLQVVANLLNNSIKFTPKGGRVAVRLETAGEFAKLTVNDSGVGFAAEMLPHLFTRFVQAESSMLRLHGGLGLGLAIVRHLVNAHGGTVKAESPGEGQGATFTVIIPLASSTLVSTKKAASHAVAHRIVGLKVLLVEDDDDTRDACAATLSEMGVEVRAEASVAEGLKAIESFKPQVILCDLAMPLEDGYEFIHQLRRLPEDQGGKIPSAALTALASAEDRTRALTAGFQLHVVKPVNAQRLADAIEALAAWNR